MLLDPFLSPHPDRLFPAPLGAADGIGADLIAGTHDHLDHIDRESLPVMLKANPGSVLVIPSAAKSAAEGLPLERVRLMDDGRSATVNGVKITAIRAAHEFFDRDPVFGYPYLSFVLEVDGLVILHMGDACIYEGLVTALQQWEKIDLAFLPINGRDARRLKANCLGNMTWQEAVDLSGTIRPRLSVPAHYGMFAFNTEDPNLFAEYMDVKFPGLAYRICGLGKQEILASEV
jgi:L-ascorbate metabolism protein UlaG (beta-lactamase superfamily)